MNANLRAVDAARLNQQLAEATPGDVVTAALATIGRERLAVASSFGAESAVLLKIVADVDPSIPVLFLNTGWLFPETIAYRDTLTERLGLTDVRTITPAAEQVAARDPERNLCLTNPDACCTLRKVEPLAETLDGFEAWINGRKRFQGAERTGIAVVELDGRRLKFNPLARVTPVEIVRMFKAYELPRHPLASQGYGSIGCMPCTKQTGTGDNSRAGRWANSAKTECGIHNRMPLVDGAGI